MDQVTFPPELERAAEEAVAAGRFRDISEVVAAGVTLLLRQERACSDFIASLDAAIAEGERGGFFTIEQVESEMDAAVDEVLKGGR